MIGNFKHLSSLKREFFSVRGTVIERYETVAVFTLDTYLVACNNFSLDKPGNHRLESCLRRCDYTLYIGDGINYSMNAIQ